MKLSSFAFLTLFGLTSSAQAIKSKGMVRGLVRSLDEDESPSMDEDVASHDSDDDDKKVKGPDRTCEWDIDDDGIEFECKAKEGEKNVNEIKDKLKYKVSAKKSKLKIKIKHEQEIETALQETQTETSFEVVMDRVIEYKKANSTTAVARNSNTDDDTEAYDWDQDEIAQELLLNDWEDFTDVQEVDGVNRFSVSTIGKDTTGEGATFYFTISQSDTGNVSANEMKIDFELANFPWMDEGNYVALLCTVESGSKVEVEFEHDMVDEGKAVSRKASDFKIDFGGEGGANPQVPFGEFSWKTTADAAPVNSTNTTLMENVTDVVESIRVVATSPVNGSTADADSVAFSFLGSPAMGSPFIYWDPSAGVGYGTSFGFATTWTTVTLVGAFVSVFTML